MKKTIYTLITLMLICSLVFTVYAADDIIDELDYVTDDAGIFTDDEYDYFAYTAELLSEKYRCGVYIVTLSDYSLIADSEPYDVAELIYDVYDLGYGENNDGILFMLSVADGDCALYRNGSVICDIISDPQILLDECVAAYSTEGYAGVFSTYLSCVNAILADNIGLLVPEGEQIDIESVFYPAPELDGYVTDLYQLLDPADEELLENKAAELSEKYGCGVYILIVEDYTVYGIGSPYKVAGDVFLACDLGEGPNKAGILLLMSMEERDITILTNEAGHAMVGPDAKDWLAYRYLKYFRDNDWMGGFDNFLVKLDTPMKKASNGKPMTWITYPETTVIGLIISVLGGFLISYCVIASQRNKMKSVFKASSAGGYIAQGGVNIKSKSDTFSRRITSRRKIETQSSSGSSGGSRSSDSRGFSGRSDKF